MNNESEEIWQHLIELNETFSSEIPPYVVHSDSRPNNFKVRECWWLGSACDLYNLKDLGELNDDQITALKRFQAKRIEIAVRKPDLYDSRYNKDVIRVTSEDIALGEAEINFIISQKILRKIKIC